MSAWMEILLYPATILALALLETYRGTLGKRFAVFGALSYSCYLLHVPLQLIFMEIAEKVSIKGHLSAFFYSPVALFLFFGLLIPLSVWTNRHFERPTQIFIQRRLLRGTTPTTHRVSVETLTTSSLPVCAAGRDQYSSQRLRCAASMPISRCGVSSWTNRN